MGPLLLRSREGRSRGGAGIVRAEAGSVATSDDRRAIDIHSMRRVS
jgi:hypothetical protein